MNQNNQTILYYVHDPMCSWCWGFAPTWERIQHKLPGHIQVKYVLGGLAPDSTAPMPKEMQTALKSTWKAIQQRIPNTEFNYNFWKDCHPRRSTFPSCRAVIAARSQNPDKEKPMIRAIQEAYYLNAKNPSDDSTLIELAAGLGLNEEYFAKDLNSPHTNKALKAEMRLSAEIGAQGFPSLILQSPAGYQTLQLDYNNASAVLKQLGR
ncbi:DsbA family protein [Leucothrix sargassi]|nr:DsbA family protein [Leucothrix sargassi]